jgi:hypothetical protein
MFEFQFSKVHKLALLNPTSPVTQCEKCFEPNNAQSSFKLSCDHILCKRCMKAKLDTAVRYLNWSGYACPICSAELTRADLTHFFDESVIQSIEEKRQQVEVKCANSRCRKRVGVSKSASYFECAYCDKATCLLCSGPRPEYHDCQLGNDTKCPKCSRRTDRNELKYAYCSYCRHVCRVCSQVISSPGEHYAKDSYNCREAPPSEVPVKSTRPHTEEAKKSQAETYYSCTCSRPIKFQIEPCYHNICRECFVQSILNRVDQPGFSIADISCPHCPKVLSERVLYELFGGEATFNSQVRRRPTTARVTVKCPKPTCDYAREQLSSQKEFYCPRCPADYCLLCGQRKVYGHTCPSATERAESELSPSREADLEVLGRTEAEKQRKPCPKCKDLKTRIGSKLVQTCSYCRFQFCWLCDQVISHTKPNPHSTQNPFICSGLKTKVLADLPREAQQAHPTTISSLYDCACLVPVEVELPCAHKVCKSCYLKSAIKLRCLSCSCTISSEFIRALTNERSSPAQQRATEVKSSQDRQKNCPTCNKPCSNPTKANSVKCRCKSDFCWECRAPLTSSAIASHFIKTQRNPGGICKNSRSK